MWTALLRQLWANKKLRSVLLLAAFFVFFRFTHVDMVGDDAHYSARAVGMADFMFGEAEFQATPLQWYDALPWWTYLSWHDHPVLLFWIQHLFLSFGATIFWTKLPYALLALGSVVIVYTWARRMSGEQTALAAALLLTLNSHFIWAGRVSYMESGVLFFTLLACYCFTRFLEDSRQWWPWGIALGLALTSKFTTLFLIPAMLSCLLIYRRDYFRRRELYYAAGVALLIFSPTIIYNAMMYADRGHFALQFSRLFGQQTPWHLSGTSALWDVRGFFWVLYNLGRLITWPYLAALLGAIALAVYNRRFSLPVLGLFFFVLQQKLIGQKGYALALASGFAAILVAEAYGELRARLAARGTLELALWRAAGLAFAVYLLAVAVNSHLLIRHYGSIGWARSEATSDNFAVKQLDDYLNALTVRDKKLSVLDPYGPLKLRDARLLRYVSPLTDAEVKEQVAHSRVILFDGDINWFSRVWLFERRRFYDNIPVFSLAEPYLLEQLNIEAFYFIMPTAYAALDGDQYRTPAAEALEQKLVERGVSPELIRRDDDQVAFKIYFADRATLPLTSKKE